VSEYSANDLYALSIMTSELTGRSVASNFYTNIFAKLNPSGNLVWMTDADGITITDFGVFMLTRDWGKVGEVIRENIANKTCLGTFFSEGITGAVKSTRMKGWRYGYGFWVIDGLVVLAGNRGQTMVINPRSGIVVVATSVHPRYWNKGIFGLAIGISKRY